MRAVRCLHNGVRFSRDGLPSRSRARVVRAWTQGPSSRRSRPGRRPDDREPLGEGPRITGCWTGLLVLTYAETYFLLGDLIAYGELSGTYDFWLSAIRPATPVVGMATP